MEIRHALALKKPIVMLHGERLFPSSRLTPFSCRPAVPKESDARYGSFDFRAAHAAAPSDLQSLLDQHESLVSCSFLVRSVIVVVLTSVAF